MVDLAQPLPPSVNGGDFRKNVAHYVTNKAQKYQQQGKHANIGDCTHGAIVKAYSKSYPVEHSHTRLPLVAALHECYACKEGAKASFEVCSDKGRLAFGCPSRSVRWEYSKTKMIAYFDHADCPNIIGPRGRWSLALASPSITGRPLHYRGEYGFEQELARLSHGSSCECRIPLYAEHALGSHVRDSGVPAAELVLMVRIEAERLLRVTHTALHCWLRPNRREMLYTPVVSLDAAPLALSQECGVRHGYNQPYCTQYLEKLFAKRPFSMSVNCDGRRLFSINGTREHRIGCVGELMVSGEAIRCFASKQVCAASYKGIEAELCDPRRLEECWRTAGVYDDWFSSYKCVGGSTPSLAQILTHTAGLPCHRAPHEVHAGVAYERLLERKVTKCFTPFAPCDSAVRHSLFGIDSLRHVCGCADHSTFAEHMLTNCFRPLGMINTCYAKQFHAGDVSHASACGVVSTTDDVATFLCQVSRACDAGGAHSHLACTLRPHVSVGSGQRMHTMCLGGWESSIMSLPMYHHTSQVVKKVGAVTVMHKFGEPSDGSSWTLAVMVPALHMSFSLAGHCPAHEFFGTAKATFIKSYDRKITTTVAVDDGRRIHIQKIVKHTVMSLLMQDSRCAPCTSFFDQRANIVYAPVKQLPQHFDTWARGCALLADCPPEGVIRRPTSLLDCTLMPLGHSLAVIGGALKDITLDASCKASTIVTALTDALFTRHRLHRLMLCSKPDLSCACHDSVLGYDYTLRDLVSNQQWGLCWDGRAPDCKHGAFRIIAHHDRCAGELVPIDYIHDSSCKECPKTHDCTVPVVHYAGSLYVSEQHIRDLIQDCAEMAAVELLKREQEERKRQASAHMPWSSETAAAATTTTTEEAARVVTKRVLTRIIYNIGESLGDTKNSPISGISPLGAVAIFGGGLFLGSYLYHPWIYPYGYPPYPYYPYYWPRYYYPPAPAVQKQDVTVHVKHDR